MAWVKIDDNAPLHRKILKVTPSARWLWICGLAYCQRLRTDGLVPSDALSTFGLGPAQKPSTLARQLVLAGLWHVADDGWRVHDFLDWNDSAKERDEKSAEKSARQKKWREAKRGETRLHGARVDASTPSAADATPPPPPQPTPQPYKEHKEQRTAAAPLHAVEISVRTGAQPASTWRRACAIAHKAIETFPASMADQSDAFKALCAEQGLNYAEVGGRDGRPLYARALDYVAAQRANRGAVAS